MARPGAFALVAVAPVLVYSAVNVVFWDRGGEPARRLGRHRVGAAASGRAAAPAGRAPAVTWQLRRAAQLHVAVLPAAPAVHERPVRRSMLPLERIWFKGWIGRFGWQDTEFSKNFYRSALVRLARRAAPGRRWRCGGAATRCGGAGERSSPTCSGARRRGRGASTTSATATCCRAARASSRRATCSSCCRSTRASPRSRRYGGGRRVGPVRGGRARRPGVRQQPRRAADHRGALLRMMQRAAGARAPRAEPAERFARFQAEVEPRLAAVPRVHRFAAVPVLGDAGTGRSQSPSPSADAGRDARARGSCSPTRALDAAGARAPRAGGDARARRRGHHLRRGRHGRRRAAGRRRASIPGPSPDHLLAADGPLARAVRAARGGAGGARGHPRHARLAARAAAAPGRPRRRRPRARAGHPRPPSRAAATAPGGVEAVSRVGLAARVAAARGHRRVERPVAGRAARRRRRALPRPARAARALRRLGARRTDMGPPAAAARRQRQRRPADRPSCCAGSTRDARVVRARATTARSTSRRSTTPRSRAATPTSSSSSTTTRRSSRRTGSRRCSAEAQRPEVGAVAPLLRYPDGAVQHAGAALGLHGYAGHPFAGLRARRRDAVRPRPTPARATGWPSPPRA